MILAGTGHRPPRLGIGYGKADRDWLAVFVKSELAKLEDVTRVITGGAAGFDQALYVAAYELGIPFLVAVPFEGQESKWPEDAQIDYRRMLDDADEVVVVCEGGYANWKYAKRDEWMVDNADQLLCLLDDHPQKSGTKITVDHAVKTGKPIRNLWKAFSGMRGETCPE